MKKIRTKLVLSLLLITLLPVFPVYILFKNLITRSLEIGFNKNVESALGEAAAISQELFALYKNEALATATALARDLQRAGLTKNDAIPLLLQRAERTAISRVDLYNRDGQLFLTVSTDSSHGFPDIYDATIRPLLQNPDPRIVNVSSDLSHVSAAAAFRSESLGSGVLIFTRAIDEAISQGSRHVVDVHQMFKTLDFFEEELTSGFLLSFLVVYAPLAGFSVMIGYYLSRRITTPLLKLVEGTKKVSEGDWEHRVETTASDEVGDLIAAFNNMVSSLKQKQDQVIALEKMATWREIARILAHEIKNPLTPIQLTVQQMKDKYTGDDPDYKNLLVECSEIVNEEIESLRSLVREFADFARMPKLHLTRGNLNELVMEVSRLYSDAPLELKLDTEIPEFDFDQEKLRRVLINLIENGLDSMKDSWDGKLKIATRKEGDSVCLSVQDKGHGMSEEVRRRIFEPYFSTKKSGVGLGLAIVKRIAEEHGGTISVKSRKNQGTSFEVKLPTR